MSLARQKRLLAQAGAAIPRPPAATLGLARGRKGKGAGGGGIEAPNTLQSKSIVRIIDLLCEGPIGGLIDGPKSIYFNGVPLMAQSGAYNFKGVTWDLRTGLPDQDPLPGFPAVENTFALGVQVKTTTPQYHEVTDLDVTRCTVTMNFPALLVSDTSNGNINPSAVHFQILVQPNGGTYEVIVDHNVQGKCTSPTEQSYTFQMPGTGPWVIQVVRLTPDSMTVNVQNNTYISAITEIVDHPLMYSNSAVIGLTFDSQLFGSTIPTRSYDIAGVIIDVPENYDPVLRTYATTGPGTSGGTWDGFTMKPAVTDNPAFIVLDLIGNDRYGMGLPVGALEATKWDLYQIAQYCDEMIPDGITLSGTEPRYTCNVNISSRDDAYRILQAFTSIFRGMSYWGSGTVRITADMPGPIVKLVNQTDVSNGNFSYSGTGMKARHSMAIASYVDPVNQWQPSPVVYQDQTQLNNLLGQNIAQIAAFGATTRGQAYRACKWLIDSEAHQYDTVTYTAALDHMDIMPGEIVELADPAYMGLRLGGRVLSSSTSAGTPPSTLVVIDGAVLTNVAALPATGTPDQLVYWAGHGTYAWADATATWTARLVSTYVIAVEVPGIGIELDQPISAIVDNGDGTNTVWVTPAMLVDPPAGGLWRMKNTVVQPREFRLIGITEPERGTFEVTGLMHDPTKYARIEYGIDLTDTPYSALPDIYNQDVGPPSSVLVDDCFVGEGTTTVLRTTVSWTPSTDGRVLTYDIEIAGALGYTNILTHLPGPSADIDNLAVDNYVFGVRGVTAEGRQSAWVFSQNVLINGQPIPPAMPLGLTAVGGTRMISLYWQAVDVANLLYYEVWRAPASNVYGSSLLATIDATSYTDSDSSVLQPLTTWAYFVRAVTTNQAKGPFAGPVEAETTALLVDDLPAAIAAVAAYAQSLLGTAPTVVDGLPSTGTPNEFVVNSVDGALYQWRVPAGSATGSWVACPVLIGLDGKITAGVIEAGAISSDEIAAGSIHAVHLASEDLLTESAQIGYLTVSTFNIQGQAVTTYSSTTHTDTFTGSGSSSNPTGFISVVNLVVTVPAAATGDGRSGNRMSLIFFTGTQHYTLSEAVGNTTFNFQFSVNGTVLFTDGHTSETTAPTYCLPCVLVPGANTINVSWAADAGVQLSYRTLTVFGSVV